MKSTPFRWPSRLAGVEAMLGWIMEKLSPEQAFDAMVRFFELHVRRTGSDAVRDILGGLQFTLHSETGERWTFDPAFWSEWLSSVGRVLDGDELSVEQAFDAVIEFLEAYQRIGFIKQIDAFLGELSYTVDPTAGERRTARAGSWPEWLECVREALEVGPYITFYLPQRLYRLTELDLRILAALRDNRDTDFTGEHIQSRLRYLTEQQLVTVREPSGDGETLPPVGLTARGRQVLSEFFKPRKSFW